METKQNEAKEIALESLLVVVDDEVQLDYDMEKDMVSANFMLVMSDYAYMELMLNHSDCVKENWNGDCDAFKKDFNDCLFYVDVYVNVKSPFMRAVDEELLANNTTIEYVVVMNSDNERRYGSIEFSDDEKKWLIEEMNKSLWFQTQPTIGNWLKNANDVEMNNAADCYKENEYKSVDISDIDVVSKHTNGENTIYSVQMEDTSYYEALDRIHGFNKDVDFKDKVYITAEQCLSGAILGFSEQGEFGGKDTVYVPLTYKEGRSLHNALMKYEEEHQNVRSKKSIRREDVER